MPEDAPTQEVDVICSLVQAKSYPKCRSKPFKTMIEVKDRDWHKMWENFDAKLLNTGQKFHFWIKMAQ